MLFTVQLELFRFFLSTVDTRSKVLCNKYLHEANDNDKCSATSLAELISRLRDGLSNVSFFSDGSKFTHDNVSDLIVHFALL